MNKSLIYSCVWACMCFFLFSHTLAAQSVIKVGYVAGLYKSSQFNALTDSWSSSNPDIDGLGGLGLNHGIDFGYRKMTGSLSWNISYSIALGGSSTSLDDENKLKLRFFHHAVGGGLATHVDRLAIGTHVLYNHISLNGTNEPDSKTSLDRLNYFSSRIYLSYTFSGGGQQRLALEPFVDVPWGSGDPLTETATFLSTSLNDESSAPLIFGLRVVLLNGSF